MDGGRKEGEKKSCMGGGNGLVSVMYTNCQSVVNKMNELRATVAVSNPDVIILTESWTHENIAESYLKIDDYELIVRKNREDTKKGRGGGILVYVKTGILAWELETDDFIQRGGIALGGEGGDPELIIHVVYRSPNSPSENNDKLMKWMKSLKGRFVVLGDFNYPDIDWGEGRSGADGKELIELVEERFWTQHVSGATQKSGNTLDLVISSDETIVLDVSQQGRLGASDHDILNCTFKVDVHERDTKTEKRDYGKMNIEEMRKELAIDWEEELKGLDTERTWQKLKNMVTGAMDRHIPWKSMKGRKKPRWLTGGIKRLIRKKKQLWARSRQSGSSRDQEAYKHAVKEVKKAIHEEKKKLEKKVAAESKEKPKQFFQYLKGERSNKVNVGPLKDETGRLVVDDKEMADVLNKQYASVFTEDDGSAVPTKESRLEPEKELSDVRFTEEKVKKKLDNLRTDAAGGPDGIPPRILKEFSAELSKPLSILYERSMDEGEIPQEWRESEVVPLHKGGSKFGPANYRPVNLTVVAMRVMESLINDDVTEHLEGNGLIGPTQHGFRKGHSCQTNLIEFWGRVVDWIDDGEPVDVMFYDFSKAFDKVEHRRLIVKVRSMGIKGKLLSWIGAWLRGRRQRVVVNGAKSEWVEVTSSVIQGSVLGPTLFKIFIDDLDEAERILSSKFADDTKTASIVKDEKDRQKFQEESREMERWADEWKMVFNADKCKVMHLGRANQKMEYEMGGVKMKVTEMEKDLGVLISNDLKPSKQCAKAAKSANQALGQIARAFHYRSKKVVAKLFKVYVRPKLEYAAQAWSPWLDKDIEVLEAVQRRAVRMMSDVKGETYEEKLGDAGLQLLSERRERGDMIEAFKVVNGYEKVRKEEWFTMQEGQRRTRQNTEIREEMIVQKLVMKGCKSRGEEKRNFYKQRVVKGWNSLPSSIQLAPSVNAFKSRYDAWRKQSQPAQERHEEML